MTTLRITVEWLDGRYHGREWPPAPHRLYQAMLAGYALNARGDPVLEAAMRHLETLPPPVITAPPVDARTEGSAAVPNNDADVALALHAKAKPALARAQAARSVTRRTRRARHVEGAVTYDWRATPETAAHHRALVRIARSVTALGLGIDLACARVSLHEHPPPPSPGVRYAPAPAARRALRVPWPGGVRCARGDIPGQPRAHRRRHRGGGARCAGAHCLRLRARAAPRAVRRLRASHRRRPPARPRGDPGSRGRRDGAPRHRARGALGGARPGTHR